MLMATRRLPAPRSAAHTPPPASAFQAGRRTPRQAANAELHITLVKAAARLLDEFAAVVKPVDLSLAQYNVLRILRGAGDAGVRCGEVGERLVHHDPDVTRLLDRLERRALIERSRDTSDRRVVRTRITAAGAKLLAQLDEPLDALHERQLGHLTHEELAQLEALADAARARVSAQ
jgi:DNA-binding MarR family transcriptional regulator